MILRTIFSFGSLVLTTLIAYYFVVYKNLKWSFFSWHPFLMTFGLLVGVASARLKKTVKGYYPTIIHRWLSILSVICVIGGFIIIYTHKNNIGKKHIQTTHSVFGLIIFISLFLLLGVGLILIDPQFGRAKKNALIRFIHLLGGRCLWMFYGVTMCLGYSSITAEWKIVFIGIPLLLSLLLLLFD